MRTHKIASKTASNLDMHVTTIWAYTVITWLNSKLSMAVSDLLLILDCIYTSKYSWSQNDTNWRFTNPLIFYLLPKTCKCLFQNLQIIFILVDYNILVLNTDGGWQIFNDIHFNCCLKMFNVVVQQTFFTCQKAETWWKHILSKLRCVTYN